MSATRSGFYDALQALYDVTALDPTTFAWVAAILVLAATGASYLPLKRALVRLTATDGG
jgi:hypothetical protein